MIRIIVRTDDAGMAANAGGSVKVIHKTFDFDLPELEAYSAETKTYDKNYGHRQVVGVAIVNDPEVTP